VLTHIETKWKKGWLVVSAPLKNISQLGLLFPIYGNMFQTTNQLTKGLPKIPLSYWIAYLNETVFFFTQQYTVMAASPWSHQKGARGDSNMFGLWSFNTLLWAACVEHCYNMLWDVAIYYQCLLFTLVRWFTYQHFVFKALLPEDHIGTVTWGPSLQEAQFFEFWQGK